MKAILVTTGREYRSQSQIFPFRQYRQELKERFDFEFDEIKLNCGSIAAVLLEMTSNLSQYDLMFIQIAVLKPHIGGLKVQKEKAMSLKRIVREAFFNMLLKKTRQNKKGGAIKKVVLDETASCGTCRFDWLPYIDLYVKKQLLRNLDHYRRLYLGKRYFADYLIRHYDIKGAHNYSRVLKDEFKKKVLLGWNLGTGEAFMEKLKQQNFYSFQCSNREIDILCRISLQSQHTPPWYYRHRISFLNRLNELNGKYNIIATSEKIPTEDYWHELRNSKICVSPFGAGEICYRDFEAVIAGCLLVKPSMEHLQTEPNIYIANQTYVPIKWDLSDLNEKCEYYLIRQDERKRIVKNAENAYISYFKEKRFLEQVGQVLERVA